MEERTSFLLGPQGIFAFLLQCNLTRGRLDTTLQTQHEARCFPWKAVTLDLLTPRCKLFLACLKLAHRWGEDILNFTSFLPQNDVFQYKSISTILYYFNSFLFYLWSEIFWKHNFFHWSCALNKKQ